jgi:hypothetical protein
MKVCLTILTTVAVLAAAGCGGKSVVTKTVTKAVPTAATAKADAGPPAEIVQFGYIHSLARKGNGFELRFDPAWFLSGVTANTAAAEDGTVEPGQPVPNDNYRLNESHRLLTYVVPADAHVTVLTKKGELNTAGFPSTSISVHQLAQLVKGQKPVDLAEGLDTGFWMRFHIDTVRALDQQYQP